MSNGSDSLSCTMRVLSYLGNLITNPASILNSRFNGTCSFPSLADVLSRMFPSIRAVFYPGTVFVATLVVYIIITIIILPYYLLSFLVCLGDFLPNYFGVLLSWFAFFATIVYLLRLFARYGIISKDLTYTT